MLLFILSELSKFFIHLRIFLRLFEKNSHFGIFLKNTHNQKVRTRKKDERNTHPFPSLSITNYRRTGYPKRSRLRFERIHIIVKINKVVKWKVKSFLPIYTKPHIKLYDDTHKLKLWCFGRLIKRYLSRMSIFVEKFFGLFLPILLTQYKCSTNICSRQQQSGT